MDPYTTMTEYQWSTLAPYFTPDECGSTNMDWEFMQMCYRLRKIIDCPMIVHCAYDMHGHAPKSYHYSGRAMDFHATVSPRIVIAAIDHVGFGGCGYYPWWNNQGFHIDNRPHDIYQRWVSPAKNQYEYIIR